MQHRHIHFCLRTESIKTSGYYRGDEQGDSEEQRMDRVQIQVMTLVFHHLPNKDGLGCRQWAPGLPASGLTPLFNPVCFVLVRTAHPESI